MRKVEGFNHLSWCHISCWRNYGQQRGLS